MMNIFNQRVHYEYSFSLDTASNGNFAKKKIEEACFFISNMAASVNNNRLDTSLRKEGETT
ncbi:hypothetical protein ISN45_At04g007940 [Arabidopsis thaliana x Arabidopsis arenosa]|uniref:Uncharacterized protein n=1 Tax=Arabidopsis thaliana x Arabidopsis arenosa TaxID=1240361 RepID=A0A8T2DXQ2_9BRAS|nr:hypothetical protein ISN45_At04g007940 [Arabidopsis thaliana x Arabidopsis arenosa]